MFWLLSLFGIKWYYIILTIALVRLTPWLFKKYFVLPPLLKSSLREKVVCVTGASGGIGKDIAKQCFDLGAKVVLVARRREVLQQVKEEMLKGASGEGRQDDIAIVQADLGKLSELEDKARDILQCFGKVNCLVNNAGIGCRGSVKETQLAVHQNVMNLNYFSQISLVHSLLPHMVASKEKCWIVAISSLQGKFAMGFRSAYAASKHACQAFYDALRSELDKDRDNQVSVCVISPGYVKTGLSLNSLSHSGESYGKMDKSTERGMSSEDCARRTIEAFVSNERDVCIAPWYQSGAIYIRVLLPNLYFFIMRRRAVSDSKLYS